MTSAARTTPTAALQASRAYPATRDAPQQPYCRNNIVSTSRPLSLLPMVTQHRRNRKTPPNTTTAARPANAHASAARGRHAVEGRSRIRIVAPRSGTALVTQILLLYFEKSKSPHPTRWRHAATGVNYNFPKLTIHCSLCNVHLFFIIAFSCVIVVL